MDNLTIDQLERMLNTLYSDGEAFMSEKDFEVVIAAVIARIAKLRRLPAAARRCRAGTQLSCRSNADMRCLCM
jgi:hypothetical protein